MNEVLDEILPCRKLLQGFLIITKTCLQEPLKKNKITSRNR